MDAPRISIIVPTRDRHDTLLYTLKTCLNQSYENLEILVSDNCSSDRTKQVVDEFADSRLTYIRAPSRLAMTDHWNFAIGHATGEFITVLGDDDGFLPNAIAKLNTMRRQLKTDIVTWRKAEYAWPSHINPLMRNYLGVPLKSSVIRFVGSRVLKDITSLRLAYNIGPCIYNSIVSRKLIDLIVRRDGYMFASTTPDIYSSLVLSTVVDQFYFSMVPFSVNGASGHSIGTSVMNPALSQSAALKFFEEHEKRGPAARVRGSITSALLDSILELKKTVVSKRFHLDRRKLWKRIIKEVSHHGDLGEMQREELNNLAEKIGLRIGRDFRPKTYGESQRVGQSKGPSIGVDERGHYFWLDASAFGVEDVNGAASLAQKLVVNSVELSRVKSYSLAARYWTRGLEFVLDRSGVLL